MLRCYYPVIYGFYVVILGSLYIRFIISYGIDSKVYIVRMFANYTKLISH